MVLGTGIPTNSRESWLNLSKTNQISCKSSPPFMGGMSASAALQSRTCKNFNSLQKHNNSPFFCQVTQQTPGWSDLIYKYLFNKRFSLLFNQHQHVLLVIGPCRRDWKIVLFIISSLTRSASHSSVHISRIETSITYQYSCCCRCSDIIRWEIWFINLTYTQKKSIWWENDEIKVSPIQGRVERCGCRSTIIATRRHEEATVREMKKRLKIIRCLFIIIIVILCSGFSFPLTVWNVK